MWARILRIRASGRPVPTRPVPCQASWPSAAAAACRVASSGRWKRHSRIASWPLLRRGGGIIWAHTLYIVHRISYMHTRSISYLRRMYALFRAYVLRTQPCQPMLQIIHLHCFKAASHTPWVRSRNYVAPTVGIRT